MLASRLRSRRVQVVIIEYLKAGSQRGENGWRFSGRFNQTAAPVPCPSFVPLPGYPMPVATFGGLNTFGDGTRHLLFTATDLGGEATANLTQSCATELVILSWSLQRSSEVTATWQQKRLY